VVDAQERTQSTEPAFAAASPSPTIFSKL
jgi:hypothetical protein